MGYRRRRRPFYDAPRVTPKAPTVQTPQNYVPPMGEVLTVAGLYKPLWYVPMRPEQLVEYSRMPSVGPTVEARQLLADLAIGHSHWGELPGDNGLSGAKNLAAIDKVFTDGWAEGAAKARALSDELGDIPLATTQRRKRKVSDDGQEPIVEAWIDKDLEHLWETDQRVTKYGHKTIQIALGWGGNAGISSEQMFWAGAVALVLTERLEAAGFGVEVHSYSRIESGAYGDHKGSILYDVMVKPSDQPIAVDTFAALTAHAGVWRAYALGMEGHAPWQFGLTLGRTEQIDHIAMPLIEAKIIPEIEVLIPNVYSKQSALEATQRSIVDIAEKYEMY